MCINPVKKERKKVLGSVQASSTTRDQVCSRVSKHHAAASPPLPPAVNFSAADFLKVSQWGNSFGFFF